MAVTFNYKQEYLDAGANALKYFYNKALQYENFPFSNFDKFIEYVNKVAPSFLNAYGKAIVTTNYDQARLREINETFAEESEGKVPTDSVSMQSFFEVMQKDLSSISNYISMAWKGTKEGFSDIYNVGTGALKAYTWWKILTFGTAAIGAISAALYYFKSKKS